MALKGWDAVGAARVSKGQSCPSRAVSSRRERRWRLRFFGGWGEAEVCYGLVFAELTPVPQVADGSPSRYDAPAICVPGGRDESRRSADPRGWGPRTAR